MLATLRTGGIDFRCVPILGVVEKAEGPECGTEPGQATVSSRFPGPRKRVRSYKVRDQTRPATYGALGMEVVCAGECGTWVSFYLKLLDNVTIYLVE